MWSVYVHVAVLQWCMWELRCDVSSSCTSDGIDCGQAGKPVLLSHHDQAAAARDLTVCPESQLNRPALQDEKQTFQEVEDRKVVVFSAFVERRLEAGGPAIRIIASGWQAEYNVIGDLYCQMWYEEKDNVVIEPAEYIRIYPSILYPEMWVSHFILCPLASGQEDPPYAVSITPTPCSQPRNTLMVLGRHATPVSNTHALCISPLYNNFPNWTMIAEWFELHHLLGAAEMTIYSFMVTKQTERILRYYVEHSDLKVNVVQWPYPRAHLTNVWCQRGALNDCLYRMALRHKYVTITDLDEILMPREFSTWPELMAKIDTPEHGVYMFQHAYFRRNYTGEEPYLVTQHSLWRTHEVTPPGKIRCKSMYKAEKAIKIDLHFPYEMKAGTQEYMVPPEEGMLHHYRFQPMESYRKYPERFTYIEDTYMHKYKKELTERVKAVLDRLR